MSASAKSRMVCPSGTDSPGLSQTKGRKTIVVVVVLVVLVHVSYGASNNVVMCVKLQ